MQQNKVHKTSYVFKINLSPNCVQALLCLAYPMLQCCIVLPVYDNLQHVSNYLPTLTGIVKGKYRSLIQGCVCEGMEEYQVGKFELKR